MNKYLTQIDPGVAIWKKLHLHFMQNIRYLYLKVVYYNKKQGINLADGIILYVDNGLDK